MLAVLWFAAPRPAHAVSKEIIELQTQVQQLLDMMQRLQSTMDTKFGVLQNLSQQTADQANQMNAAVKTLEQRLNQQNDAANAKMDTVSGQVQSLNDSVDELKSRIAKLDKTIQEMQTQLQSSQQPPANGQIPGATPPSNGAARPVCATSMQHAMHWPPVSSKMWCTTTRWTTWPAPRSST
jgi:ABC-type transporter Mla subunit MlaD